MIYCYRLSYPAIKWSRWNELHLKVKVLNTFPSLLLLFLSCQLTYKKKRKVERSTLCEEFMERASRPQELINIELLEVSRDPPDSITPVFSVKSCCLSSCRNCPTFMSSTRSWRLLSLRRQDRRARPSAWSVKTSSLSSAALWWISTSGSKRRWDLPTGFCENEKSTRDNVVIIMLLHEFPLYTLWSCLVRMGLMKMKTAVRGRRLSRRWVTLHLDSVEVWGHHLLKGLKHHWCTSCLLQDIK